MNGKIAVTRLRERERETYLLTLPANIMVVCCLSFQDYYFVFYSIGRHVNLDRAVDFEGAEINICKNQNIILIPHETYIMHQ